MSRGNLKLETKDHSCAGEEHSDMTKGWDRVIMGCEREQNPPCAACPCGTPAGEVPRGTTVALLPHGITLSLSLLSQFFHLPALLP